MEKEHMRLLTDYSLERPDYKAVTNKRRLFTCLYFLAVGIVIELYFFLRFERFLGLMLFFCLAIAVVFWFAQPAINRSTNYKVLKILYSNPKHDWIFGERSIELFDDGLEITTSGSFAKNKWETISTSGFIEDALIIIIGPNMGHVIKQDQVIEGDFSAFASEVMRRTQSKG